MRRESQCQDVSTGSAPICGKPCTVLRFSCSHHASNSHSCRPEAAITPVQLRFSGADIPSVLVNPPTSGLLVTFDVILWSPPSPTSGPFFMRSDFPGAVELSRPRRERPRLPRALDCAPPRCNPVWPRQWCPCFRGVSLRCNELCPNVSSCLPFLRCNRVRHAFIHVSSLSPSGTSSLGLHLATRKGACLDLRHRHFPAVSSRRLGWPLLPLPRLSAYQLWMSQRSM
ncbi:hypothetical protein GY45DRAFT_486614 [Cubamyces sp. BRFM 1775]|nr:hypothetical protein GY45DRAFT_486614 [Cubamyces sp. BRFM 1775]